MAKINKKQELLQKIREKGVLESVIEAMSRVEREDFVSSEYEKIAYEDIPIPTQEGQTTPQPSTVAIMLSLLNPKKGHKVLELGSGSGYTLSLLAEIVEKKGRVFGVELIPDLVEKSKKALSGQKNIIIYKKSGSKGLQEKAPFDRILVSAAMHEIPESLLGQLKDSGILVAPKGSRFEQEIVVIQRKGNVFEIIKKVPGYLFVPFVGD